MTQKLLPFEFDPAFVKMMARNTEITNTAMRQAYVRWTHVVSSVLTPQRDPRHLNGYIVINKEIYHNRRVRKVKVIRHVANGQIAVVQMGDDTGFSVYPFLDGVIPRYNQLDHYTFGVAGQKVWLYDPKEQFLESARAEQTT